jgi:hypothetical protein
MFGAKQVQKLVAGVILATVSMVLNGCDQFPGNAAGGQAGLRNLGQALTRGGNQNTGTGRRVGETLARFVPGANNRTAVGNDGVTINGDRNWVTILQGQRDQGAPEKIQGRLPGETVVPKTVEEKPAPSVESESSSITPPVVKGTGPEVEA